jgi:hypothetical protein
MCGKRGLTIILVAGALWGLTEIFVGDLFYKFHVPFRSAALTSLGITVLIVARLVLDKPGTSLAAGLVAAGLRCLVPKLYICHAVAITVEACAFDGAWTALRAGEKGTLRRIWLTNAAAVYSGFLCFGLVGLYHFGFGRWVEAGLGGVIQYSLRSGTISSLLLVPLTALAAMSARNLRGHLGYTQVKRLPSPNQRL